VWAGLHWEVVICESLDWLADNRCEALGFMCLLLLALFTQSAAFNCGGLVTLTFMLFRDAWNHEIVESVE
jgi:hypothetical protein